LTDIAVLDLLFWGAAAVALWFVAIGISALTRQSSATQRSPNAP